MFRSSSHPAVKRRTRHPINIGESARPVSARLRHLSRERVLYGAILQNRSLISGSNNDIAHKKPEVIRLYARLTSGRSSGMSGVRRTTLSTYEIRHCRYVPSRNREEDVTRRNAPCTASGTSVSLPTRNTGSEERIPQSLRT